ncbi:MAG: PEP/pyruvate-binding domain-containing protein, partial [Patescibacteria group bacterium]|nr:PEP/pyruvate-binding domain-containing protein [Patescibacteria group bacterium]
VVVQKMVQSEVAGVCFTVHPVSKNKNQLIIEAGYGLGEAIVSGIITPDSYTVDKKSLKILDKDINNQKKMIARTGKGNKFIPVNLEKSNFQKLLDSDIIKLSKICIEIEKHYKKPQDIEWAFKDNKFYILQSRPITTL